MSHTRRPCAGERCNGELERASRTAQSLAALLARRESGAAAAEGQLLLGAADSLVWVAGARDPAGPTMPLEAKQLFASSVLLRGATRTRLGTAAARRRGPASTGTRC